MYMRFRPGKVSLKDGLMCIANMMQGKCLSTALPLVGPRWLIADGRPESQKGCWLKSDSYNLFPH